MTTPHDEERQAERQRRNLEKARRAAEAKREKEARGAIAAAIAAVDHTHCNCGLRKGMTHAELRALGAGCTSPRFVCPTLDAVRRRVGR